MQGTQRTQKLLLVKRDLCTGCLGCAVACAQQNEGMSAPSRARIHVELDPFGGQHRIQFCMQCKAAPCARACPVGAIHFVEAGGYWDVDYETCIGCKQCIAECPLGVMFYDPMDEKVIKCHTCHGDPACVKACAIGALVWCDAADRASYRKGNPEASR